jgi:hypothetical protein
MQVTVDFTQTDVSGCNFGGIVSWFIDLKAIVQQTVQQAIINYIDSHVESFNVPPAYSPYPGVLVAYAFTGLEIAAGQHIYVTARANVSAILTEPDGSVKYLLFDDPDSTDAETAPPLGWNSTYLHDGQNLVLLNGMRISSTMLTALTWAGDQIGAFDYGMQVQVLDARLNFNLTWARPLLGIPPTNDLFINIGYGHINGTCANPGRGYQATMIDVGFVNLNGNGYVYPIDNNGDPGFVMQVSAFDVDHANITLHAPPIPLPEVVVTNVLRDLIVQFTPVLNDYLSSHPFVLPANIAPFIPNPILSLVHQGSCCNNMHGYVDLMSLCSCTEPSGGDDWKKCGFSCASYAVRVCEKGLASIASHIFLCVSRMDIVDRMLSRPSFLSTIATLGGPTLGTTRTWWMYVLLRRRHARGLLPGCAQRSSRCLFAEPCLRLPAVAAQDRSKCSRCSMAVTLMTICASSRSSLSVPFTHGPCRDCSLNQVGLYARSLYLDNTGGRCMPLGGDLALEGGFYSLQLDDDGGIQSASVFCSADNCTE